jgi:protein-disulfide isomerase/uncharacterized membrane protein
MLRWTLLQVVAVVLSLAAADISFNLLVKHITGSPGPAWFAGCRADEGDGARADCAAVLASRWSYWPPMRDDDPANKPRIPVAFLGLVYYSMLSVWFVGVGRPSRSRRGVLFLPMAMMLFGLIGSALFTYIMFTRIDEWCPWCMATHILNVLIAACLLWMWPRESKAAPTAAGTDAPPAKPTATVLETDQVQSLLPPAQIEHPSWRLACTTLIAMGAVAFGQKQLLALAWQSRTAATWQTNFKRCMTEVNRIRKNPAALIAQWSSEPRHGIAIRPDDPARKPSLSRSPTLRVVLFSDFECSSCQALARFLDAQAQPLFAGNLEIIFKHFPLDNDCNPHVAAKPHPNACLAARAAEAARLLGGAEAFWTAHEYLFEHQDRLKRGRIQPDEVADHLGLNGQAFLDAMNTEAVVARIREDVEQAKELGVGGTPAPFIDGRRARPLYMTEINFWDRLADSYWQNRNEPRPEATKLRESDATPGSPGLPAAP